MGLVNGQVEVERHSVKTSRLGYQTVDRHQKPKFVGTLSPLKRDAGDRRRVVVAPKMDHLNNLDLTMVAYWSVRQERSHRLLRRRSPADLVVSTTATQRDDPPGSEPDRMPTPTATAA